MTIVPRRDIELSLIRACACGLSEDEAITEIAARYCLPVEAVQEVINELKPRIEPVRRT